MKKTKRAKKVKRKVYNRNIITKKCQSEKDNSSYYTVINTKLQKHVHTTKKETADRIEKCYNEINRFDYSREKDLSIRKRVMKLMGYNIK